MKKRNKIVSVLLVFVLIIGLLPLTASASSYSDVKESDWFYSAVEYAKDSGLMSGTSNSKFSPYGKVTRATVSQLLYNWQGKPPLEIDLDNYNISDVRKSDWYYTAAYWTMSNGVLNAYSDYKFRGDEFITRQDCALALKRYSKMIPINAEYDDVKLKTFSDYKSIEASKEDCMKWMASLGFYNGDNNNNIRPLDTLTRAELAQILYNMRDYIS